MASRRIRIALIATLFAVIFPTQSISAQNWVTKTDAEANCVYGTKSPGQNPLPAIGTYSDIYRSRGVGFQENDPCWTFFYWTSEVGPSFSYSAAFASNSRGNVGTQVLCDSASDPKCAASNFPGGVYRALTGFYKCTSENDVNCIASISVIDSTGKSTEAKFAKHFPDSPMIPASTNPQLSYPQGGSPTLWTFEVDGKVNYIYSAGIIERQWDSDGSSWGRPAASFHYGLQAVQLQTGIENAKKPTLKTVAYKTPEGISGTRVEFGREESATGLSGACSTWVALDEKECLTPAEFLPGYKYRVVFQVTADLGFFLNGRLDEPVAFTEKIAGGRRLVIEGAPAKLFAVSTNIGKAYMTNKTVAAIKNARDDFARGLSFAPSDLPPMGTGYPELLAELTQYFGDRTTFNQTAWTLNSTPTMGRYTNSCTNGGKGEFLGIISTNATAFNGDPPQLDPKTKVLSYTVAAPHFDVDGKTENIGHYYMNMNADFIKCILGVDTVPAFASIGITYGQGEQRISTVAIKQDKTWLRLRADNFTFSMPKIEIKFAAPAKSTKPATGTKTITCVKGKVSKKISGTNPKCPSGWTIKR